MTKKCFDEKVRSRQILLYSEQKTRSVLKFCHARVPDKA